MASTSTHNDKVRNGRKRQALDLDYESQKAQGDVDGSDTGRSAKSALARTSIHQRIAISKPKIGVPKGRITLVVRA